MKMRGFIGVQDGFPYSTPVGVERIIPSAFPKFAVFFVLALSCLVFFSTPQFAAEAQIYRGEIKFDHRAVHNYSLKHPILMIENRYYIPLSQEFLECIGLEFATPPSVELNGAYWYAKIYLRRTERKTEVSEEIFGIAPQFDDIHPLIASVYLDSDILRSNYPIYLAGDIPYLCLDDSNDFPIGSIDLLWRGLTLEKGQLPERYSVFDSIPKSEFVRDQGSTQKCWAFAACSLLEIKIALTEGKYLNLSEDHLIEHCPISADAMSGGNWGLSSSYLTKLLGPVLEHDENKRNLGYYVQEYSETHGAKEIKKAIKKNGAVLTSLYYGPEISKFYDPIHFSYYHSEDRHRATHELLLVGWDDKYPKEKFKQMPPGDGAFIAMNSFGTDFGEGGFFYISYYDDIASKRGISIDQYDGHSREFRVISKDRGGVTHFESIPHQRDLYAIQKLEVDHKSKIRGVGVYSNGKAIVSAYCAKTMPKSEDDLIFLGDTYFENAGFKTIESYQNLEVADDFYIVLKYHSSKSFIVPIEAPYPGIFYNVPSEPGTSFLAYLKNGRLISTPLEDIKKDAILVLRLLVE